MHSATWSSGFPTARKLDPQKLKMDVLLQPSVQKIAIANPEHAPYGRAAMAALEHFQLKGLVSDKFVLGENISQAAQFVQSGNAQAGLIAESLALSPPMKSAGSFWEVPADSYPEIQQVVGIVTSSKHKQAAQAFIDFVTFGGRGQQFCSSTVSEFLHIHDCPGTHTDAAAGGHCVAHFAGAGSASRVLAGVFAQDAGNFSSRRSCRCRSCCRRPCWASTCWSRSGR